MQQAAYTAWLGDTLAGRSSVLLADTNEQAAQLAGRPRADLVRMGRVDEAGVVLADGNRAGAGDGVVTRLNDRRLVAGGRFVANRDQRTVDAVESDGSLRVRRPDDDDGTTATTLPARYVAEHVEMAYASTVHGAQGRTVDTAQGIVTARTSREGLYVAMTRGRCGNWAYVACDVDPGPDTEPQHGDPVAVLGQLMTTGEQAVAATQVLRDQFDRSESLATLWPQWQDAVAMDGRDRWVDAVASAGGAPLADRVRHEPAWPALAAQPAGDGRDRCRHRRRAGPGGGRPGAGHRLRRSRRPHWRLQRHTRPHASEAAGPGGTVPAASFVATSPGGDGAMATYGRRLAERMDRRVEALGAAVVADPPAWLGALGPVPEEPARRLTWTNRASVVAAYREMLGVDGSTPLDERPGSQRPDAQGLVGPGPRSALRASPRRPVPDRRRTAGQRR